MSNTDGMGTKELPTSSHESYTTNAVIVREPEKSSTIAGLSKKRCPNNATEAAAAVMKNENVLDAREAVKSFHLPPKAMATQKALLLKMKKMCRVYNNLFQNLHQTHELHVGEH